MDTPAFTPSKTARDRRPANVAATGSAAPQVYTPIPDNPGDAYTIRSHAAQYGLGRRYGIVIRAIILHTTEGGHPNPLTPRTSDFTNSLDYESWRPETVSATCHVGPGGECGYEVPEDDRPWTTGRWNDESLTVELIGRAHQGTETLADGTKVTHLWTADKWRTRTAQLDRLTVRLVDWCRRHDIPPVWLTASDFAQGASRAGQPLRAGTKRGITDHWTANQAAIFLGHDPGKYSHTDIGPGLREVIITDVLPEVARRLAAIEEDDMRALPTGPRRAYDSRPEFQADVDDELAARNQAAGTPNTPLSPGTLPRRILTIPGAVEVGVNVTVVTSGAGGFVRLSGDPSTLAVGPQAVGYDTDRVAQSGQLSVAVVDGAVWLAAFGAPCDVIVDVWAAR